MEGAAAVRATARSAVVLSSNTILSSLVEYGLAKRVTSTTFAAQMVSFDKRVEALAMRSFSHNVATVHCGAFALFHLSEIAFDPPVFVADVATTIKAEDAMAYFNSGLYVVVEIVAIDKLEASNKVVFTCVLYNAQDFADEGQSSIASRNGFPSGEPFDLKFNYDDVARMRFVQPRQVISFALRPKPVAEPVILAAAAPGPLDQFTSALSIVATSEGKRKEKKMLLDQSLIRDSTVFGGVQQEAGPLTLAAREALGRTYPSLELTDSQVLALITFKLGLTHSLKAGESKTISVREFFVGLFPNSSAPPSSDNDTFMAVIPALTLLWHSGICSELNNVVSRVNAQMHTMATRDEDKNKILAKLWDRFLSAVSAVTPVTTLGTFVLNFAHDEQRMKDIVSLHATIRANSSTFGGGGGGGGGGGSGGGRGDTDGGMEGVKHGELSKFCVYALDKNHKNCPQGTECKRIWRNVPFDDLDARAVEARVLAIRSLFDSGKRKTQEDGKTQSKKAKKEEEEED